MMINAHFDNSTVIYTDKYYMRYNIHMLLDSVFLVTAGYFAVCSHLMHVVSQLEELMNTLERTRQELDSTKQRLSSTQQSLQERDTHLTNMRQERRKQLEEILEMKLVPSGHLLYQPQQQTVSHPLQCSPQTFHQNNF